MYEFISLFYCFWSYYSRNTRDKLKASFHEIFHELNWMKTLPLSMYFNHKKNLVIFQRSRIWCFTRNLFIWKNWVLRFGKFGLWALSPLLAVVKVLLGLLGVVKVLLLGRPKDWAEDGKRCSLRLGITKDRVILIGYRTNAKSMRKKATQRILEMTGSVAGYSWTKSEIVQIMWH